MRRELPLALLVLSALVIAGAWVGVKYSDRTRQTMLSCAAAMVLGVTLLVLTIRQRTELHAPFILVTSGASVASGHLGFAFSSPALRPAVRGAIALVSAAVGVVTAIWCLFILGISLSGEGL